MRQTFLLFMAFAAGTAMSMAQSLSGGIKGGINVSNFTESSLANAKKNALVGYHAGGYLNFKLGALSLQPELLVSTAGSKIEENGLTEDYKITYATVPVMIQFKTAGGFFVEAGPQVGFKISESIPDQTIETFAKGLDLSAGVGLGYKSKFGLGFNLRYLAGLSKVGDFNAGSGLNPDFKNSMLQAGVFLKLGGKK